MSHLIVPDDDRPWPTLGPGVCALMQEALAFGPGDLKGEPYRLDDEDRAIVYRMYEVFPHGHPQAGQRRFDTAVLMLRKGTKKSERAGALAAVELHPEGPVRCDGFRREGGVWIPVGRPVVDPYIPMVAYSETQAEDTAFAALYAMISEGTHADRFDISLERIMRARGDGRAEALSNSPNSRDGARTTFQIKEETHRWTLPNQLKAHSTMSANLAKRPLAEPWELQVTTPYEPGAGSLAEKMHDGARYIDEQGPDESRKSRLFFFYRWADESIDISTPEGLLEAIEEASGPSVMAWSDPGRIARQWTMPGADGAYLERTWLARCRKSFGQAFDVVRWKDLGDPSHVVLPGALISLAWHGSRYWDAAALIGTELGTGYQWPIAIWQRPPDASDDWEVDEDEVNLAVAGAFEGFMVWKFYVNPDRWESSAAKWAADYGIDRVLSWKSNAWTQLVRAVTAYSEAIEAGELSHPGQADGSFGGDNPDEARLSAQFTAHIGACHRRTLPHLKDADGDPVWVPSKERSDSPFPINAAMAGIIGWQARLDAIKSGALEPTEWRVA